LLGRFSRSCTLKVFDGFLFRNDSVFNVRGLPKKINATACQKKTSVTTQRTIT